MRNIFFILSILFFSITPIFPDEDYIKEQGLRFCLDVIETYLTGDLEKYCTYLADYIYSLDGAGPLSRETVFDIFSNDDPFPGGNDYSIYSITDYLETYEPVILKFKEYIEEYPSLLNLDIDGWSPDEDDFLFIGYRVKTGQEAFLWDDLLVFMVTHSYGVWMIIAISG
jgi:hypothetical protein